MDFKRLKDSMIKTGIDMLEVLPEGSVLFNMVGDLLYELDFGHDVDIFADKR